MICYNISLYLYQNTNIIVMAYFRYNILISQYEYWKDQIKSHKFQIIQKFQLPNIAGNFILSIISNVLDVLSIKHFKISEIFGLWYRGVWYRDIIILNIIQRHNFFQSFASIGRVDLVWLCEGFSWQYLHSLQKYQTPNLNRCSWWGPPLVKIIAVSNLVLTWNTPHW